MDTFTFLFTYSCSSEHIFLKLIYLFTSLCCFIVMCQVSYHVFLANTVLTFIPLCKQEKTVLRWLNVFSLVFLTCYSALHSFALMLLQHPWNSPAELEKDEAQDYQSSWMIFSRSNHIIRSWLVFWQLQQFPLLVSGRTTALSTNVMIFFCWFE